MERRRTFIAVLIPCLTAVVASVLAPGDGGAGAAPAAAAADTLQLDALLAEALRANPEIAEARALWHGERARVPRAGALEDPVLGFMLDDQPFEGDGGGSREISLSQALPFPGKRGHMTEEARRTAEAAGAMARDTARRVIAEVKVAYWELFALESQLATLEDNRAALESAAAGARARYESGIAGQQDYLLALVEAGEVDAEIVRVAALAEAARAKLNLLLDRDAAAPLGRAWADTLSPFGATLDELLSAARRARPSVLAREERLAAAEAEHRLARVAARPDFLLGAAYMQRSDEIDAWRAEMALTLPLWKGRKQDAAASAAARRVDAARHGLAAERNRASASVEEQYARTVSERRVVAIYRSQILPQAELAYQSARASYLAGRETFLVLLETLRRRIDLTRQYYEYFADAEMHLAWLEEAAGIDLGAERVDLERALEALPEEEAR
jgi:outer membrane protein TolC